MLKLTIASDDGSLVHIRGEGEISQVRYQVRDNPVEQLLGPDGYGRKVLFDLEAVDFLDSSGIGWLVVCHKNFREKGGRFVLYNLPPRIEQILSFCRMDKLLLLAPGLPEAQKLAQGEPS